MEPDNMVGSTDSAPSLACVPFTEYSIEIAPPPDDDKICKSQLHIKRYHGDLYVDTQSGGFAQTVVEPWPEEERAWEETKKTLAPKVMAYLENLNKYRGSVEEWKSVKDEFLTQCEQHFRDHTLQYYKRGRPAPVFTKSQTSCSVKLAVPSTCIREDGKTRTICWSSPTEEDLSCYRFPQSVTGSLNEPFIVYRTRPDLYKLNKTASMSARSNSGYSELSLSKLSVSAFSQAYNMSKSALVGASDASGSLLTSLQESFSRILRRRSGRSSGPSDSTYDPEMALGQRYDDDTSYLDDGTQI